MRLAITALCALALSCPAFAQQQPAAAPASADDVKVNQLIIYGDDECPPSTNDEIIVCARMSEDERYRIPPMLRTDPNDPVNQSWANQASELSYVGRTGIGSCSTVGAGGMTGCFNNLVRQALAERYGGDAVNWERLIDEARQERLDRIDAESEAIEQDLRDED